MNEELRRKIKELEKEIKILNLSRASKEEELKKIREEQEYKKNELRKETKPSTRVEGQKRDSYFYRK